MRKHWMWYAGCAMLVVPGISVMGWLLFLAMRDEPIGMSAMLVGLTWIYGAFRLLMRGEDLTQQRERQKDSA